MRRFLDFVLAQGGRETFPCGNISDAGLAVGHPEDVNVKK